jgi:hypothetical protein
LTFKTFVGAHQILVSLQLKAAEEFWQQKIVAHLLKQHIGMQSFMNVILVAAAMML